MRLSFFVLFLLSPVCAAQTITRDLDGDGKIEKIVLDAKRDPALRVFHGKKLVWQGILRSLKPWKITTADVDGDGQREIILGVHKGTRFFPKPHNCLFIYNWDGTSASKKWLGSSLSKPFADFAFGQLDSDRDEELVSLETLADGKKCVMVYSWNGFGFDADWQSGAWPQARLIGVYQGKVIVEVNGRRVEVAPKGNSS